MYQRTQLVIPGADFSDLGLDPVQDIWTPDDLGVTYWDWDADETASFTKDGTNNVAAWTDKKSGLTMAVPVGYTKPILTPAAWFGGAALTLVGDANLATGCMLECVGPIGAERTVFVVTQRGVQNDDATSSLRKIVNLHVGNPSGSNGDAVHLSVQRPTVDASQLIVTQGGIGTGSTNASLAGFGVGNKAILSTAFTAAEGRVRINDGDPSSASDVTGNVVSNKWSIGGFLNNKQSYAGLVKRVIIVNSALSDDLRYRMAGFLAWSTGLQSALAPSHPYHDDGPYAD